VQNHPLPKEDTMKYKDEILECFINLLILTVIGAISLANTDIIRTLFILVSLEPLIYLLSVSILSKIKNRLA